MKSKAERSRAAKLRKYSSQAGRHHIVYCIIRDPLDGTILGMRTIIQTQTIFSNRILNCKATGWLSVVWDRGKKKKFIKTFSYFKKRFALFSRIQKQHTTH
jgi:hypothetical protein